MGPGPGPDGGRGAKIEIVTTILAFLFVLGVLVFVHELGHFLAARRLGIKVITFSLGFGPKLLTTHRDGVEYAISAIPLGGYVKMAGESVEETRTGAPDEFLSKSKWERFQVLIMGPVMNLALAVILTAIVLYQGAERLAFEVRPVVLGVVTANSPAAAAGPLTKRAGLRGRDLSRQTAPEKGLGCGRWTAVE